MSLTVKDLTKRYGDRTVVDRLSFGMPGPGVYALLGTNGAGKTTSIRMMLNMLSRDGGEVLWNGEPLDISRCNVGYLAEERGLYPKYALMDQLLYSRPCGTYPGRRPGGASGTGHSGWRWRSISIPAPRRRRDGGGFWAAPPSGKSPSGRTSCPRAISRKSS